MGRKKLQKGRGTSSKFRGNRNTKIYRINVQNPTCDRNRNKYQDRTVTIVCHTIDIVTGSQCCSVTEALIKTLAISLGGYVIKLCSKTIHVSQTVYEVDVAFRVNS